MVILMRLIPIGFLTDFGTQLMIPHLMFPSNTLIYYSFYKQTHDYVSQSTLYHCYIIAKEQESCLQKNITKLQGKWLLSINLLLSPHFYNAQISSFLWLLILHFQKLYINK